MPEVSPCPPSRRRWQRGRDAVAQGAALLPSAPRGAGGPPGAGGRGPPPHTGLGVQLAGAQRGGSCQLPEVKPSASHSPRAPPFPPTPAVKRLQRGLRGERVPKPRPQPTLPVVLCSFPVPPRGFVLGQEPPPVPRPGFGGAVPRHEPVGPLPSSCPGWGVLGRVHPWAKELRGGRGRDPAPGGGPAPQRGAALAGPARGGPPSGPVAGGFVRGDS